MNANFSVSLAAVPSIDSVDPILGPTRRGYCSGDKEGNGTLGGVIQAGREQPYAPWI
jgi:hypothetical protein